MPRHQRLVPPQSTDLSNHQYNSILHRLEPYRADSPSFNALSRLLDSAVGSTEQYISYAGTQKVNTEHNASQSYAQQLSHHLTGASTGLTA